MIKNSVGVVGITIYFNKFYNSRKDSQGNIHAKNLGILKEYS